MSFETVRYAPDRRPALVSLLERVGTTQLTDEEFAWWFDRNPAGEGIVSLAVAGDDVVGRICGTPTIRVVKSCPNP